MSRRTSKPSAGDRPAPNPDYRYSPPRELRGGAVVELDGGAVADLCRANREADERARRAPRDAR